MFLWLTGTFVFLYSLLDANKNKVEVMCCGISWDEYSLLLALKLYQFSADAIFLYGLIIWYYFCIIISSFYKWVSGKWLCYEIPLNFCGKCYIDIALIFTIVVEKYLSFNSIGFSLPVFFWWRSWGMLSMDCLHQASLLT